MIYDKIAPWSQLVENGGTYATKAELPSDNDSRVADENDGVRLVKFLLPDKDRF